MTAGLAVIIIVLGFFLGVLANWLVRPAWLKNGSLLLVVVLTMGALAAVTLIKDSYDTNESAHSDQQSGELVSSPVTTTPGPSPTTEPTPEATAASKPATSPTTAKSAGKPADEVGSQVALRYLTEIGPIGGYGNNEAAGVATIGGIAFTKSITFAPGVFNKTVKDLSFNVPSGLGTFKATLGLSDKTLPDYVAQIDITRRDGTSIVSKILRAGESQPIEEVVAGAGIITVKVTVTEWAADAINSRPQIVLGDGQFVRS